MQNGLVKLFKVGACRHPEAMTLPGSSWKCCEHPAIVALLYHHDHGFILFDTGYAHHFLAATERFPQKIYHWLTPVSLTGEDELLVQLKKQNISPDDIKIIFLSHFHGDHIAGIKGFPNAQFVCSEAVMALEGLGDFKQLCQGYLSALLPQDFWSRTMFYQSALRVKLSSHLAPFTHGYDLFGDRTMIAIDLPGHAKGHAGLLVGDWFFVGDAAWSTHALDNQCYPNPLTHIMMDDKNSNQMTFDKLVHLKRHNKQLKIIPSHCQEALRQYG